MYEFENSNCELNEKTDIATKINNNSNFIYKKSSNRNLKDLNNTNFQSNHDLNHNFNETNNGNKIINNINALSYNKTINPNQNIFTSNNHIMNPSNFANNSNNTRKLNNNQNFSENHFYPEAYKNKSNIGLFLELNNMAAQITTNNHTYMNSNRNKSENKNTNSNISNSSNNFKQNNNKSNGKLNEKEFIKDYIKKNFDEKYLKKSKNNLLVTHSKKNFSNTHKNILKSIDSSQSNRDLVLIESPNKQILYFDNQNSIYEKNHYNNNNHSKSNKNLYTSNNFEILENKLDQELNQKEKKENLLNFSKQNADNNDIFSYNNNSNSNSHLKKQELNFINEYFNNKKAKKIEEKDKNKTNVNPNLSIHSEKNFSTQNEIIKMKNNLNFESFKNDKKVKFIKNDENNAEPTFLEDIIDNDAKTVEINEVDLKLSLTPKEILNSQIQNLNDKNKRISYDYEYKTNANSLNNLYETHNRSFQSRDHLETKYILLQEKLSQELKNSQIVKSTLIGKEYEEPSIEILGNLIIEDNSEPGKNKPIENINNYEKTDSININMNKPIIYSHLNTNLNQFTTNNTEISNFNNQSNYYFPNNYTTNIVNLTSSEQIENLTSKNFNIAKIKPQEKHQIPSKNLGLIDSASKKNKNFNVDIKNYSNYLKNYDFNNKSNCEINKENVIEEDYILFEENDRTEENNNNIHQSSLYRLNNSKAKLTRNSNEGKSNKKNPVKKDFKPSDILNNKSDLINNDSIPNIFQTEIISKNIFNKKERFNKLYGDSEKKIIENYNNFSPKTYNQSEITNKNINNIEKRSYLNSNLESASNKAFSEKSKNLNEEETIVITDENINFVQFNTESDQIKPIKNLIKNKNEIFNLKADSSKNIINVDLFKLNQRDEKQSNNEFKNLSNQNENQSKKNKFNEKIDFFPYPDTNAISNLTANKLNLNSYENVNVHYTENDIASERKINEISKSVKDSSNKFSSTTQIRESNKSENLNYNNYYSTQSNSRIKTHQKGNDVKELIYGLQSNFFNNHEKINFLEEKLSILLEENRVSYKLKLLKSSFDV